MNMLHNTHHRLIHRLWNPIADWIDTRLDIHGILARKGRIAIIWAIEDVRRLRPDLTDEQAWFVLERCAEQHDCNHGLTWDTLSQIADDVYPPRRAGPT